MNDNNQVELSNKLGFLKKNKLLVLIAGIILLLLILLSYFVLNGGNDKETKVNDIKTLSLNTNSLSIQANKKNLNSLQNSTLANLVLDSSGNLTFKDSKEVIDKNVIDSLGVKALAGNKLFYFRKNSAGKLESVVYDIGSEESTVSERIINAYTSDQAIVYKFARPDGLTQLHLGDSEDPFVAGYNLQAYTLKENRLAILDYHSELKMPMSGYVEYDSKQNGFNYKLDNISLETGDRVAQITLANIKGSPLGIDNKIFYLDNNDRTHINDGEKDIMIGEPIKLNTISKLDTDQYLYAQASREKNIINIRKLDLNSASTSLVQSYSFNGNIFDTSGLGLGDSEKYLATPISNVDFDLENKRYIVGIDEQYYGLPANSDPLTGKSLSTNSLLNKLKNNIGSNVSNLKDKAISTLIKIKTKSEDKALAHDDETATSSNNNDDVQDDIPQECKDIITSPGDTSLEGRQRLVDAIDCFSGFKNKAIQEKDILTSPIALNGVYNLGQFDNSIIYLNNLVLNGKTFTIAKTASEYKYSKGMEYFANQLITFEGTKEQEQGALNNTLKNGGFFYGRQTGFNIAPTTGSNKVDYLTDNEKVSLKLGGEALAEGGYTIYIVFDDPAACAVAMDGDDFAVINSSCTVTGTLKDEIGNIIQTVQDTYSGCGGFYGDLPNLIKSDQVGAVYFNGQLDPKMLEKFKSLGKSGAPASTPALPPPPPGNSYSPAYPGQEPAGTTTITVTV